MQPAHAEIYNRTDSALPPPLSAAPSDNIAKPQPSPGPTGIHDAPAPAPVADIKTFAENYYANCAQRENPILTGESKKKLCQCTALRIAQTMSLDEIKTMQEATPQGQIYRNKMILQVYTPCIEYPAYALVHDSCVNNADIKTSAENICNCVAAQMAGYVRDNAPATIERALQKNPGNLDPLRAMLDSPEFSTASQAALGTCLKAK